MTWLEFKKKLSLYQSNDRFYEILYRYDNDGIVNIKNIPIIVADTNITIDLNN